MACECPHPVSKCCKGVLGCAEYIAYIANHGDPEQPISFVPWTELEWGRRLDDASDASVVAASETAECCELTQSIADGKIEPWRHELVIQRIDQAGCAEMVWSGPITRLTAGPSGTRIEAFDILAWLDHRVIAHGGQNAAPYDTGHTFVADDYSDIVERLMLDGYGFYLADDGDRSNATCMNPEIIVCSKSNNSPANGEDEREVLATQFRLAGQEIRELARNHVDYYAINRCIYIYGKEAEGRDLGVVTDESFLDQPDIVLDGTSSSGVGGGMTNAAYVTGANGQGVGWTNEVGSPVGFSEDQPSQDVYCLLESVDHEPEILDFPSAAEAAQTRVEFGSRAVAILSGGRLSQDAPICPSEMIPGSRITLAISESCLPVVGEYRIESVEVGMDADGVESVDLELTPVGTTI